MPTWTAGKLERLRRDYPTAPDPRALAVELGCTLSSLRSKAGALGIKRRDYWTAEERAYLREHYGKTPTRQIALALGRTVSQAHRTACRLGLQFQPRAVIDEAFLARVRALHARGHSDPDIAKELKCDRHTVSRSRRVLNLPSNAHNERNREKARRAAERQDLSQARTIAYRRFARESGWPEDLRPRAVQILNLLAAVGVPLTRRQIAEGVGMPWKGASDSLTSNDPEGSHLAHLAGRGLVRRMKGLPVIGRGKGCRADLYILGSWALEILTRRAREQESACHHHAPTESPVGKSSG